MMARGTCWWTPSGRPSAAGSAVALAIRLRLKQDALPSQKNGECPVLEIALTPWRVCSTIQSGKTRKLKRAKRLTERAGLIQKMPQFCPNSKMGKRQITKSQQICGICKVEQLALKRVVGSSPSASTILETLATNGREGFRF